MTLSNQGGKKVNDLRFEKKCLNVFQFKNLQFDFL